MSRCLVLSPSIPARGVSGKKIVVMIVIDGMTVDNLENGETIIEGLIQDQSELVGVINQIHSLNPRLISVNCKEESG